jgi:predicted nucleic acid-binding protein
VPVYIDSSALLKRAIDEPESNSLDEALARYADAGMALVASSLAWIEVSRALRMRIGTAGDAAVTDLIDVALSGIAERPLTPDVVGLARRIAPPVLRSLDAIHLASAVLLDADAVITYDERLAAACRHNGLSTVAPA